MPRSSVLTFPDGGAPTEKPHLQKIDSKVEEEEDGFKEVAISLLIDEGADEEDLDTKPSSVHDTDGGGGEESRVLRFDRGPRINEEGGGEYAIDGEDDANTDDDDDDSRRGGDGNGSRSINDDGSQSINDNGSQSINDSDDDDGGDDPSDDERLPQYPPIPPGFGMFPPPPPGYYPYYPPPHPHHYPYPPVPPPPGYYPPPPPGYYPPLPPGHMMPPAHPYYTGERDPSGNLILAAPGSAGKRSRTRIKTIQDLINRKLRKNAQSRHRAARLRDKVESIKTKAQEELEEEEARLCETVEERRARKNNRSKERALEKKLELERVMAMPENERTEEEQELYDLAIAAKKRKNEGDRLRRERLKKMGLKVKPPGVSIHARARRPLSGEGMLPLPLTYGAPPHPGMMSIPFVGPPPPGGAMGLPPLIHDGSDPFHYPPPVPHHPQAYQPPPSFYAQHQPMKGHSDDNGIHIDGANSVDRPGSAITEQEVSELLLQDHPDGDDDDLRGEVSGSIDC